MKKSIIAIALLTAISATAVNAAQYKAGDIVVRGGATMVDPDSDKSSVKLNGADSGLKVSVDDNTQLGLNFVYFYDSNWAIELLAATPFKHDVKIHDPQGITEGVFGVNVDGITLGEVTHLPPTLSALYYFDTGSNFQPYVGAGINYTIFFDEEFKSAPKSLGFNDLDLDGSFGFAVQVGADYQLNEKWHINGSVRYIDIGTDAEFKIGDAIKGKAEVDVDPMVYSIMLGYKF